MRGIIRESDINIECPNCHDVLESVYISVVDDYICEVCGNWHEGENLKINQYNNNNNK